MTDLHTYSEAACAECHPHPEHGGPCDLRPGPLDGFFPTGPLPGRRTSRLPRPVNLIPPPRPPSCSHMELRSACALCRDKP